MEVHHHSHTPRRKWSHYFWEFLMLFLAVFCGFLAEYQLEHVIEHNRSKVYANKLYDELKKDTARLNELIDNSILSSKRLDTLSRLLWENKKNTTGGMLYYYGSFVTVVEYFSPNNATIEELKGSGNLRLMKIKVAQKISEYDNKIRELEREYGISKSEFDKMESLYFKIFDGYLIQKLFPDDNRSQRDSVFRLNLPLINNNPKLIKEFSGWVKFESNIYQYQTERYLTPISKVADDLLATIKKEYHFK